MSDSRHPAEPRSAVVLGARNLGGAIIDTLIADDWRVAGVARSSATLAAVAARGAQALQADASDPGELRDALECAAVAHDGLDLIVNAVNATRPTPGAPFGGGPVGEASLDVFRALGTAVAEQAFVFLSEGVRALQKHSGGTLIQVTGGSSRYARGGAGCWAAGAFGTRALVQAVAQEVQDEPIHVALLVIDGTIGSPRPDSSWDAAAEFAELGDAVRYLSAPHTRRVPYELHLTRTDRPWQP
jgi:NAD(P)-dependent dehydrogenase (short-subunit alcohol dehydrogenase family)